MDNSTGSEMRKKRPPMQLYVPPAQRTSRLISNVQIETPKIENCLKNNRTSINNSSRCAPVDRTRINNFTIRKERKHIKAEVSKVLEKAINTPPKEICCCLEDAELLSHNSNISSSNFSYQCNYINMFNFRSIFPYIKLLIYSIRRIRHTLHWIQKNGRSRNVLLKDNMFFRRKFSFKEMYSSSGINIFLPNIIDYKVSHYLYEEYLNEFQNSYCTCGSRIFLYLPNYKSYYYQLVPDFEIIDDGLMPEDYLHCYQENEKKFLYIEEYINKMGRCLVVPALREADLLLQTNSSKRLDEPSEVKIDSENKCSIVCAKKNISNQSDIIDSKLESMNVDRVIVLDERESPKFGVKFPQVVNNRNKQNEHDQEKEIMRKTKQNINRKTRPIIKYVDEDNHTLTIEKSDISNWEDLFNEEGELQDEIFNEVVEKVDTGVSVFRTTGDYSSSDCKPIEELEHIVELYGFPATFETHDIISAFSELNSDSMYVKWVDDTHALLVLGSYIQAQKAVGLSNSLIKVRPMSGASKIALEKANRLDLKPAMKRPQTNLQTARRLITTHLGAKSKISKEQNEKEREDLRAAKELKKQAKQNEKAAWEGSLRSSIN